MEAARIHQDDDAVAGLAAAAHQLRHHHTEIGLRDHRLAAGRGERARQLLCQQVGRREAEQPQPDDPFARRRPIAAFAHERLPHQIMTSPPVTSKFSPVTKSA
ncbi:MAG: hypothetical protein AB7O57_00100 [Hyphomicrobiaceae bacterium]